MSEKVTKLIEEVQSLTVLELSELVKALEEEFGVSASAPAAVAVAAPAASEGAAAEAKSEFDVVLKSAGANKVVVIKAVIVVVLTQIYDTVVHRDVAVYHYGV